MTINNMSMDVERDIDKDTRWVDWLIYIVVGVPLILTLLGLCFGNKTNKNVTPSVITAPIRTQLANHQYPHPPELLSLSERVDLDL